MLDERGFSLVLAALLCGCSERAHHTVEEYRKDPELRHAMVERCSDDPGGIGRTPDCVNARQAAAVEDRVRLRDMPAIGLDDERNRPPSGPTAESKDD